MAFYIVKEVVNMLVLSEATINELKNKRFKVYTKEPLNNGCECFNSHESFDSNKQYYISSVKASNIQNKNGKFYYVSEEFDDVADFWPKHIMNLSSKFIKNKKKPYAIKSNKCIIDVSGLPAFNGLSSLSTNEDVAVYEYRFYLTLFENYTVEQCQYERHNLYDAKYKSSKYDLTSKMQCSDFLKSKDFTMINSKRADEESVSIGYVIKESSSDAKFSTIEYGTVFINMSNQLSIMWH